MKKPQGPILTPAMMKAVIELATKAGIEAYHKEEERERKKRRDKFLYDTKKMLKSYRDWVDLREKAVYSNGAIRAEGSREALEAMMTGREDEEEIRVDSIQKEAVRTHIMVEHIMEMMDVYERSCIRSQKPEELRRFRTIQRFYLDLERTWTQQEIADIEGVDVSTVYKDLKEGVQRITALVFGVDGVFA